MTNKRNPDMAKKAAILGLFGLLVIIIIGIALAIYFGTKKSDDEETPDKPEFTFDANAKKTINPEESSGSKEGYRIIEYAGSDLDKSKLIDLTLSWTNGQGFGDVNKIILTRYVGGTKIQDDIEVTDKDMMKDYGTGSVTFKGSDVKASAKGTNVIKAYWNVVKTDNLLATAELDITEDDFSYTVTGPFGEYDIKVSIVSDTFKLTKSVKKIYYNLSFIPDKWYRLQINSSGTYSFKSIDNTETLTFDGQTKFKMKTYKGKKILIHPNDDKKILVVSLDTKKFKSESDMSRQDWGRASFTLTAATTITPGKEDYEDIQKGEYKSPNGQYSLEFKDTGNLVLSKGYLVNWESKTEGNDKANRIVVRPQHGVENNSALTFTKTDDFAGENVVKEYRSIGNKFTKPYTLILDDTGILTIIDKNGKYTEALDFIKTLGGVNPGDTFRCKNDVFTGNDVVKAFRYIGHNQRNKYKSSDALKRMDAQGAKSVTEIDSKYCGNMKEGRNITNSVITDFPELVYDSTINLGVTNLCTSNSNDINTMKTKCKEHDTCGGIGQQSNGCWHQYKGKGYGWPESVMTSNKYSKGMFNFGLGDTSKSYLFRM
jgi:hypothetical protein